MNKTNIKTDNELLPGLNIAHHADPEVKGSSLAVLLVLLDLLSIWIYTFLLFLFAGRGPLRGGDRPRPLKDPRLVWGGPATGGATFNQFFQERIRARGKHASRRPHDLLGYFGKVLVRLQRKPGSTLPAARKGGQVFLYGALLHCPDAALRRLLENARERTVFLCRSWDSEPLPRCGSRQLSLHRGRGGGPS